MKQAHTNITIDFRQMLKQFSEENTVISTVLEHLNILIGKKNELQPHTSSNINSKWILDLNVECRSIY